MNLEKSLIEKVKRQNDPLFKSKFSEKRFQTMVDIYKFIPESYEEFCRLFSSYSGKGG